jgi:polysaccharide biosynthesis transport protein
MSMDQGPQHPYPVDMEGRAIVPDPRGNSGYVEQYRGGYGYPNYPVFDTKPEAAGFDFYKYLRILMKYRWLIAASLFSCIGIAIVVTLLMVPIYRSTTSIQIDREAMSIVKVDGLQPDEGQVGALEFYQTQYELLSSRSLAERVVSTIGLVEDKDFNVETQSLISTVKDFVLGSSANETKVEIDAATEQGAKLRKVVDRMTKTLVVAPVRGSKIVKVSIDHPNPKVAQRIANGYAEVFIADNLDRRFDATAYARKFLEDRLAQLKQKLEVSERDLVKYAEAQGIIQLDNNKNLSASDLEAINLKLSEARGERVKRELLWKQAQATDGLGLKEILDSEAVQENRKLRTQLAAEYQQKLAIYKPAFPEMVQLRSQIKELDLLVRSEVSSIKQSIEAGFLAAKGEEETLQSQLDASKTDVVEQRNRGIEYNILQREVDTNRTLYEGLLQRYKEIGVAGGIGTNNISIVDKAALPFSPRFPRPLLNVGLAAIAGLLLGCIAALGLDYLDDSFKTPEDIERELGLSVLGVVPKPEHGNTVEEEMADPRSSISEALRSLRTALQFSTSEGLPRTLLVTSSKPSEGKTTNSIHLAYTLARVGQNVLLIDGDLRNASIHRRMKISNEFGLTNYLAGSKRPEEVVQATETECLVVMTSGPLPPNPVELLSSPKLPALLAMAAESFDIVIIDGPPVMGLADSPVIGSIVQATMVVVAANETRRNTVRVALKRLQVSRANIIGAVLSKFDAVQSGYGYGYGYGDYNYHSYGQKELQDLRT